MNDSSGSSHLDWNQLRLFLAVARAGTLTAAAARMKITQPTAGRQSRGLEEAAGTALFQRSHHGFRLTDAGETMLAFAQNIEDEALQLERQLMNGEERLGGVLRLSTSDWFASHVLAGPLADFASQHKNLTVELVADFRLSSLHRREADITQRRFTQVRYGTYLGPGYRERFGDPLGSLDGTGHHLVTMDTALVGTADARWLQQRWPQARLALRSNNRDAQAQACLRGLGIAVLPRLIGERMALERLELEPPGRDVWLGYHHDVRHSRRIRLLVDHLAEQIAREI